MNKKFVLILLVLFVVACKVQDVPNTGRQNVLPGWYKISILYPNDEGKQFDMDYYSKQHMPMVAALFGDKLKGYSIDQGLTGRTPNDAPTYLAIGCFYFEHLSDYEATFGPNAKKIRSDIPNYTDVQPIVQIDKVVK